MIWAKSLKIPAQEKIEFLHSYFPGFCLDFKQFAVVLSKSQNFFFAIIPSNDRFRSHQDFAWISSNLLLFFQNPKTFFLRKCLRITASLAMGKKLQTGIVCRGVKKAPLINNSAPIICHPPIFRILLTPYLHGISAFL